MKQNTLDILVGASVLLTATIFFIFAYNTTNRNYDGYNNYYASFDRADGLNIGSDVKMSGVIIGKITKFDIDKSSYAAKITFAVNNELNLPEDTAAEIISDGLLGGKYLALVPGAESTYLNDGASIVHTQSSVNLESLIGQFIFSSVKK